MKRKGIGKGEKKRSSKDLVMIAMGVMVVMTAMAVFVPTAAATGSVTDFTITAANATVGATAGYNITVNTTGYGGELTINITLPARFSAVTPTSSGATLAQVDIYEETTTGWLMRATFEAGADPSTQVNATAYDNEGSSVDYIVNNVNYSEGGTTEITGVSTTGGMSLDATVTLPTTSMNGSLNASITLPTGKNITNVSISIGGFVTNPATAGVYTFSALVNSAEVTDTVTVTPVGFNIGSYDTSGNCTIEKAEALQAVTDYFMQQITKANALEVITAYFMTSNVC